MRSLRCVSVTPAGFAFVVMAILPQGCAATPSAAASPWATTPSPLTGAGNPDRLRHPCWGFGAVVWHLGPRVAQRHQAPQPHPGLQLLRLTGARNPDRLRHPCWGFGAVVWHLGPQGCAAAPSAAASPWTTTPSPLTGAGNPDRLRHPCGVLERLCGTLDPRVTQRHQTPQPHPGLRSFAPN